MVLLETRPLEQDVFIPSLPADGLRLAMKTVKVRRRENRELAILKQLHNNNIVNLRSGRFSTCRQIIEQN